VDGERVRALGWSPAHSFADGLANTVAWYRDHRSWWEPIKSGEFAAYYGEQYRRRLSTKSA
jgi:dTDP-glucose 4,6-dehydratase